MARSSSANRCPFPADREVRQDRAGRPIVDRRALAASANPDRTVRARFWRISRLIPDAFHAFAQRMEILRYRLRADGPKTFARAAVGILQRATEIIDPEILQRPALDPIAHLLEGREGLHPSGPKEFRRPPRSFVLERLRCEEKQCLRARFGRAIVRAPGVGRGPSREPAKLPRHIPQPAVFFLEDFVPDLLAHEAQEGARFLDVFARFVDCARFLARSHVVDFGERAFQFLARDPADSRRQSRVGFQTIAHKRCGNSCAPESP